MDNALKGRLVSHQSEALDDLFRRSARRHLVQSPAFISAVAGEGETVWAEVRRGDILEMAVPFVVRKGRFGLRHLQSPWFAPFSGPLVDAESEKLEGRSAERFWRECLEVVSGTLEDRGESRELICAPGAADMRQLAWSGWELRPHYNYVTRWKRDGDWRSQAESTVRREAGKAERAGLRAVADAAEEGAALTRLWRLNAGRQGLDAALAGNIGSLSRWLHESGSGFLVRVEEEDGTCHAAGLFGHDEERVYYLAGASDPEHLGSGAPTLLHFAVMSEIERRELPRCYDWVGANTPQIARFKRKFNPGVEMLVAARWRNRLLKLASALCGAPRS